MPESENKKQPPDGLRESLMEAGKAFVTFRLPASAHQIILAGKVGPRGINNNESLISGRPGFLMAGFTPETPTLWLQADYFSNYTSTSGLLHSRLPGKMPALPLSTLVEATMEEYLYQVKQITGLLKTGVAGKVVLSRMLSTPFENPLAAPALFDWLCSNNPNAFVYLAYLPPYGLWLGATPETLLSYNHQKITTMALAGTRRSGTPGKWSEKDTVEHAFVADYIREKLELTGCKNIQQSIPYTTNAGNSAHLRTDFSADCPVTDVPRLIGELHPTPAVCGWPKSQALEIINQTEKHQRAYYTGYLGPTGNDAASLFVNLRCMQLVPGKALIYAGGGLTSASDPQAEWDETVLKSETMMAAIEKIRNLALF